MGYNGKTPHICRNRRIGGHYDIQVISRDNGIEVVSLPPREFTAEKREILFSSGFKPAKWSKYIHAEYLGEGKFRHHWISAEQTAEITDARAYRQEVAEDMTAEVARRVKERGYKVGICFDDYCLEWIRSEVRDYIINLLRKLWIAGSKART